MKLPLPILIFATISTLGLGSDLGESVAGVIDIEKLQSSQILSLAKEYSGTLSLKAGIPDINHSKLLRCEYNCFTFDSSKFSETDQPYPKIPGIFYGGKDQRGEFSILGDFAFFDERASEVAFKIENVKTMKGFRRLLPRAIPMGSELVGKDEPVTFSYSWAKIDDQNRLFVTIAEAEEGRDGFRIWIWEGECVPTNRAGGQATENPVPLESGE